MQALVYRGKGPPAIEALPIPRATPGTAVLKVLATLISPNSRSVFSGTWGSVLPPVPFVFSGPTIGRVHEVGDDATALQPGRLVIGDFHIASRDSDASILQGYIVMPTKENAKLARAYKDGSVAEYARLPLENVHILDEDLLCNKLGYSLPDLLQIADCAIATAALYEVCELKAGDVAIVAPSTGRFGGCIVQVALALGARVVAAGRNQDSLDDIAKRYARTGRISTATMVGDAEKDLRTLRLAMRGGEADAFLDMSPTGAKIAHFTPCIHALRHGGRAALVGGDIGMLPIPYGAIMSRNIRLQGLYMFSAEHMRQTIKLVESGILKVGNHADGGMEVRNGFTLDQLELAYEANEEHLGFGRIVALEP